MKKLLLILLCVPLMFSCGETDNLQRELTVEERKDGYIGKGTFTYPFGDKYVGEYKDGNRSGQGTYTWENPWEQYVGQWLNAKKHGYGKVTYSDGIVKEGLWKEGDFIK